MTQHRSGAPDDVARAENGPSEGEHGPAPVVLAVETAVSAIQRWLTRPDVRRAMAPGGEPLSATENWLLGHIAAHGSVRMSDLARWQNVDRSTMTAQIRRLEDRGLVVRGGDPADRRAVLVSLTETGRRARARYREVALRVFERLLASWTPSEQQSFEQLLTKFAQSLDPVTVVPEAPHSPEAPPRH